MMMAMTTNTVKGKVVFMLVDKCKTDKLVEGDSKMAWDALLDKFEVKNAPTCFTLKEKITNTRQDKFQDPEEFITEVESKVKDYKNAGGVWDDVTTLEHICYSVANPYRAAVRPLWRRIGATNNPLTLKELRED